MNFILHTPDGESRQYQHDDSYRFTEHGLLVITQAGQQVTYAPGAWTKIVQDVPDNRVRGQ